MARIPRVVVPGLPHHVTQRGARRMSVFLQEGDERLYLRTLREQAIRTEIQIWAYCLMPNHVHLIVVPPAAAALARGIGESHRRYAEVINRREGWRGHLWQERFWSVPLDDAHLRAAMRYVLLNPVRAGLVERPEQWPHSSAATMLSGRPDPLVDAAKLRRRFASAAELLGSAWTDGEADALRHHTRTGRPLGDDQFTTLIETLLERVRRDRSAPGARGVDLTRGVSRSGVVG